MAIFLSILFLLIGLGILLYGAEIMVRGSASMAAKWGISSIVIGLTVVAFGTSAPELVISLFSAMQGTTDLAIANVVGSNMANILLILGIAACIKKLKVQEGTTYKEIPFALLGMFLVLVMGNDGFFDGLTENVLTRSDGISFIAFFIIFLYYTYGLSKVKGEKEKIDTYSWTKSIIYFIIGLAGLVIGGQIMVNSAIDLALLAGMSETLVGLTIVALGTSLPELATTIVAVRKGHTDLAIGNVIGSNIFNIFWILGLTSIVAPLPLDLALNSDILFTTFITLLLFVAMFIGTKQRLTRAEGIVFLCLYAGYMSYAVLR